MQNNVSNVSIFTPKLKFSFWILYPSVEIKERHLMNHEQQCSAMVSGNDNETKDRKYRDRT